MGTFATFSEQEGERRTALRVERDGSAMLLVTERHGEVVASVDRQIDPTRAAELVDATAVVVPDMVDGRGPCTIGFGHGSGHPATWAFDPRNAPGGLHWVVSRFRGLAAELSAAARVRDAGVRRATRRRASGDVGVPAFLAWTGIYFAGHLVASVVGLVAFFGVVALVAGGEGAGVGAGLLSLLFGLAAALGTMAITFFGIGRMQGRRYGDVSAVWQCALAAIILPSVVILLGGGGWSAGGAFFLPFMAKLGASTVAGPDEELYEFTDEVTGRYEAPPRPWA